MPVFILAGSLNACSYHLNKNNDCNNIDCYLHDCFIRLNKGQKVMPQYLFLNCNIKNYTKDTLIWHYLGFNKGLFGELSEEYSSKAFLRLKTKDSLRLFQECYEPKEFTIISPHDSLQILLSLDDFWNNSNDDLKDKFDSIESLIEDLVYYTKDTSFVFYKSSDYKYSIFESESFEEGEGSKTTIPYEELQRFLK